VIYFKYEKNVLDRKEHERNVAENAVTYKQERTELHGREKENARQAPKR